MENTEWKTRSGQQAEHNTGWMGELRTTRKGARTYLRSFSSPSVVQAYSSPQLYRLVAPLNCTGL